MKRNVDLTICNLTDTIGNKYIGIDIEPMSIVTELNKWEESFADNMQEQLVNMKSNKNHRDNGKFHITIMNVMEVNKLVKEDSNKRKDLNLLLGRTVNCDIIGIGLANNTDNITNFIVIESEELNSIREDFSLKKQDYHITLGFDKKDVFGKSKARDSMFIIF